MEFRVTTEPRYVDQLANRLKRQKLGLITYWYEDGFDFQLQDESQITRETFETIVQNFCQKAENSQGGISKVSLATYQPH